MLFKNPVLLGIASGQVKLAFRRWQKPTVKNGTLLHTPFGLIAIKNVEVIKVDELKEKDAKLAGYGSLAELLRDLKSRPSGQYFKIRLAFAGEDPRKKMAKDAKLSSQDLQKILQKLERLDSYSKSGPWTKKILKLIAQNPAVRASELATTLKMETDKFKANTRKLKNLGLTISLGTGYKISPRGRLVLKAL